MQVAAAGRHNYYGTAIGWTGSTAAAWQRILGSVHTFADLEPELLGRVEELIDFVTELSGYGAAPRGLGLTPASPG